ncbi:hypothetical protein JVU11DRAFT_10980 [Chiua virens]|nr:hypothetical protein JVU11DRAFT_10980 [Chiua virens]
MSSFKDIWEWDTIDQTTYDVLFNNLSKTGTTDFYLHRLLFMLRFSCDQSSLLSAQRETLKGLIYSQSGLVRLAAIAASAKAMNPSDSEPPLLEDKDAQLEEVRVSLQQCLQSEQEC